MKQTDKGIFIHRINYSDTSLIVSFYTENKGIQKFIFPGGKKKSHALYPLSICEIGYYLRPDSELGKLTDVGFLSTLGNIPTDPICSSIAFFIADLLQNCLTYATKDISMFHFLEERVKELNEKKDLHIYVIDFMIGLTFHLGIEPQIDATNKPFFNLEEGEFTSIKPMHKSFAEGSGVILIQNLMRNQEIHALEKVSRTQALQTMIDYYRTHIPRFNVDRTLEIIRSVLYT